MAATDSENHPIHLACVLGHASCLWHLVASLAATPWHRGRVTLTRAMLTPMTWLELPAPVCGTSRGTPAELAVLFHSNGCLPILFQQAVKEANLASPPSRDLVLNLFQLVSAMLDSRDTAVACVQLSLLSHERKLTQDLLHLFCELLCSGDFALTSHCTLTCLPMLPNGDDQEYRTVARYLSVWQLQVYCSLLETQVATQRKFVPCRRNTVLPCSHVVPMCRDISVTSMQRMLSAFVAEQQERSLQWSCVLAHREFLNKDPRRLWLDGSLPGGLRRFFPVPFGETFREFAQQAASTESHSLEE